MAGHPAQRPKGGNVKIAVLVKRVPDTASVFKVADDQKSVVMDNLKFVLSPYDEVAVEQAVQIKEAGDAEVVIVSLGVDGKETTTVLRTALAMGADSALVVCGEDVKGLTSKGVAKALAAAVKTVEPDLVLAGKQAVDDDASQVPERVAEQLGLPHVSVITTFELADGKATVTRAIEGGHLTVEVPLPAVLTAEKGLNTPRYPTLPNIMKAKKKPAKEVSLGDLGLSAADVASDLDIEQYELPRQDRRKNVMEGELTEVVPALVKALREEEKVL